MATTNQTNVADRYERFTNAQLQREVDNKQQRLSEMQQKIASLECNYMGVTSELVPSKFLFKENQIEAELAKVFNEYGAEIIQLEEPCKTMKYYMKLVASYVTDLQAKFVEQQAGYNECFGDLHAQHSAEIFVQLLLLQGWTKEFDKSEPMRSVRNNARNKIKNHRSLGESFSKLINIGDKSKRRLYRVLISVFLMPHSMSFDTAFPCARLCEFNPESHTCLTTEPRENAPVSVLLPSVLNKCGIRITNSFVIAVQTNAEPSPAQPQPQPQQSQPQQSQPQQSQPQQILQQSQPQQILQQSQPQQILQQSQPQQILLQSQLQSLQIPDPVQPFQMQELPKLQKIAEGYEIREGVVVGDVQQKLRQKLQTEKIIRFVRITIDSRVADQIFGTPGSGSSRPYKLQSVSFVECKIDTLTVRAMSTSSLFRHVQILEFKDTKLTDKAVEFLGDFSSGLRNLKTLRMVDCGVSSIQLANLPVLAELDVQHNNLDDEAVRRLSKSPIMRTLKNLDLSHNKITNKGAVCLASLSSCGLERLNLANNHGITNPEHAKQITIANYPHMQVHV